MDIANSPLSISNHNSNMSTNKTSTNYPDCIDPKTETCRRAAFLAKLQIHTHNRFTAPCPGLPG